MTRNRSLVIIGLCSAVACERAPDARSEVGVREGQRMVTATRTPVPPATPEPPSKPPRTTPIPNPAPARPAVSAPREPYEPDPRPAHADAIDAASGLPLPPSDEPREYADWLSHLPRAQQRRIARFCRANPVTYEAPCGGIGPLHIPLPPHIRAVVREPTPEAPRSRFPSMEDWHLALSAAQVRYVERACPGGDDQPSSDLCGDNTPLVVAFDNQPVAYTAGGTFAFQPGAPVASDWPTAVTPWIALDLDHDHAITSGAELFGSSTVLPDGTTAPNGFVALAALDDNHDGRIDAADPAFGALLLWADHDGDHRSSPDELTALSGVITSISLDDHVEVRCDARGNCERERATLTWRDRRGELHTGSVIDVHLPPR